MKRHASGTGKFLCPTDAGAMSDTPLSLWAVTYPYLPPALSLPVEKIRVHTSGKHRSCPLPDSGARVGVLKQGHGHCTVKAREAETKLGIGVAWPRLSLAKA